MSHQRPFAYPLPLRILGMSSDLDREERLRLHEQSLLRPSEERKPNDRADGRRYRGSRHDGRGEYRPRREYSQDRQVEGYYEPKQDSKPLIVKEKPNFKPSGLLAKDSNNIGGIRLKYTEPEDAAWPPSSPTYHIYSFVNGAKVPETRELRGKNFFLFGRDANVVDIRTDHESCSKQHAVIQFRKRSKADENGKITESIIPYVIDLESSNGTFINEEEIPTSRFIELRPNDILRFGDSTTDNVLIES